VPSLAPVSAIDNHLSAAIRKTGARSRLEALRTAEGKGWM
jgi:DNA-binding NarL/FixJ family response regulator